MATTHPKPWSLDLGYLELKGLQVTQGKPVVVALHGYLDNANSMIGLAEAFSDSHFIAIDLAGHGQSGHRPAGAHYNQLDYVQDLHQMLEKMKIDAVTLVGHSLGGILASLYAALFPHSVKAVISIDALGPLTLAEQTTTQQIRDAVASRSGKMLPRPSSAASLDDAAKARAKLTDLDESHCRRILARNITLAEDGSEVWNSDSRLRTKSWVRYTDAQARELMANIQCPVLVIGASNSFKALGESFEKRSKWFSQIEFSMLPGGHHIHLEQATMTQTLIANFVSKL